MKGYVKRFCLRGMLFAWGGPVILAIVWLCLMGFGVVSQIPVQEAILGILSSTVMAFVAAGISIVYEIEKLPKAFAGLIQCVVLYVDYLGVYVMNGWIPVNKIWVFTLIFLAGFLVIWFCIYISVQIKVQRMNRMLKERKDFPQQK